MKPTWKTVYSFRLEKNLVERIDHVAEHLSVPRSRLVELVLDEYVRERGAREIERLAARQTGEASSVDIFA